MSHAPRRATYEDVIDFAAILTLPADEPSVPVG
jgi:hypothetical protein